MISRLHIPEYEEEFLDTVYAEMMEFSGLDTHFINNILEIAESDDDAYEILSKWFASTNTAERKYHEEQMTSVLLLNKML